MLDIKFVRENKKLVKDNIKKRFQNDRLKFVDEVIRQDEEYRKVLLCIDGLGNSTSRFNKGLLLHHELGQ